MLSTDKLTNYNNIQASVEKLTDKETKADAIEALNNLSDEQLQIVNSRSDILDKILRGIECFNKNNIKSFYGIDMIEAIINLFSQGRYDRLININSHVLELLISYGYDHIDYSFNYNYNYNNLNCFSHLNDTKFNCLIANEDFCKFLLKTNYINNFLNMSFHLRDEDFTEYINNQDLILVYYCTNNEDNTFFSLKDLMPSPNRGSMIDKLYSLKQQGKLYCDKKTLDLILLNSPIIKQLIYNDAGDDIIKVLRSNNYEGTKLLLEQVQKCIQQKIGDIEHFIKYPDLNKSEEKYYTTTVVTLKILSIMELIKNNHDSFDDKLQSFSKILINRSIEEQVRRQLENLQITQATPNVQSLT